MKTKINKLIGAENFINEDKISALRTKMISEGALPSGPTSEIDGLKLLVAYCDQEGADEAPEDMDAFMAHEAAKQGIL